MSCSIPPKFCKKSDSLVQRVLDVRVPLEAVVAIHDALAGPAADHEGIADHAPLRLVVERHHLGSKFIFSMT